jgi:hypothetical protein
MLFIVDVIPDDLKMLNIRTDAPKIKLNSFPIRR